MNRRQTTPDDPAFPRLRPLPTSQLLPISNFTTAYALSKSSCIHVAMQATSDNDESNSYDLFPPIADRQASPPTIKVGGSGKDLAGLRAHVAREGRGSVAVSGADTEDDVDGGDRRESLLFCAPLAALSLRGSDGSESDCAEVEGKGDLVVSSRRIFFLSSAGSEGAEATKSCTDLTVDAGCLSLHAVASPSSVGDDGGDDGWHVYCQLTDGEGDGEYELLLHPRPTASEKNVDRLCRNMFEALSHMARLNPYTLGDGGKGEGDGYLGGANFAANDGDENYHGQQMVAMLGDGVGSGFGFDEKGGGGIPSEEERMAMLQRLDGMLVVPKEYEVDAVNVEGKFDDAESDEDGDDDNIL